MMPKFENGIKFLFLLLLTNVSSKSYPDPKQNPDIRDQPPRLQIDQSELSQTELDQLQKTLSKDNEGDIVRKVQNLQDQLEYEKYNKKESSHHQRSNTPQGGSFLGRLLDSRNGPVVVFLTPGSDSNFEHEKGLLKTSDLTENDIEQDEDEEVYVPKPGENDAYVLYNILRTTQEDEDLDPAAQKAFEKTKDMLRSAFALRCGAKASCERKCPEKKPECPTNCAKIEKKVKIECERKCPERPKTCERKCEKVVEKKVDECEKKVDECEQSQEEQEEKCQAKCQKIYDELDACPKPKKSCGPKCGRTMPPNWLLRALQNL